MRLYHRVSGSSERDAVLIHGFNCDAGDWWEVAPVLEAQGYRVIALDLRGHGLSRRADSYTLDAYAQDVVDTIERRPALAIGHSLGACVLGRVADRLRPERAIYLDPPWSPLDDATTAALFPDLTRVPGMSDAELGSTLRRDFPRWSDRAIQADIESWRRWDPATGDVIIQTLAGSMPSTPAIVPSLVVAADPSIVCRQDAQRGAERLGYSVRTARGLSHSLFRDDLRQFFATIDGWF